MHPADQLRLSPDQCAILTGLSEVLASGEVPTQELLTTVATSLAGFFGDTCVVSLLSEDRRWLLPAAVADPDPEPAAALKGLIGARVPADRGFGRHVLSSVTALRLSETSPEVVLIGRPELSLYVERFGVRGVIIAPMRAQGRAIGHVMMLRHRESPAYTPQDERFVQVVSDWLALAVQCGDVPAPDLEPRPPPSPPELDLSDREREVLRLLAVGHTNREIAERLVLSVRTVEWHRSRIQWKLGVTGRAALARVARAHGLAG